MVKSSTYRATTMARRKLSRLTIPRTQLETVMPLTLRTRATLAMARLCRPGAIRMAYQQPALLIIGDKSEMMIRVIRNFHELRKIRWISERQSKLFKRFDHCVEKQKQIST